MPHPTDTTKLLYPELSYKIMNLVFEVHNQLGPGYSEDIYENALTVELTRNNINFERQKSVDIFYKDVRIGVYRLDLIIEQKIILELKAVKELNELFEQQLLSYLKATGLRLGLLVNFGSRQVQSIRKVL